MPEPKKMGKKKIAGKEKLKGRGFTPTRGKGIISHHPRHIKL